MCNYVETFYCNNTYNGIYKLLLRYHSPENKFFQDSLITRKQGKPDAMFLMKSNTCFMALHVAQVKYEDFLHRLI